MLQRMFHDHEESFHFNYTQYIPTVEFYLNHKTKLLICASNGNPNDSVSNSGWLIGMLLVSRSGLVEEDAVEVCHYNDLQTFIPASN